MGKHIAMVSRKVSFTCTMKSKGFLVIQSGEIESTGRVELDPADPKTERAFTINLGNDPLPFRFGASLGLFLVEPFCWELP